MLLIDIKCSFKVLLIQEEYSRFLHMVQLLPKMMGIYQLMINQYTQNYKIIRTERYKLRKYVAEGVAFKYKQCNQLYQ